MEKIQYKCSKCKDTSFIFFREENGYEYVKECECRKMQDAIENMKRSGIADAFQNMSFDNYIDYGNEQIRNAKNLAMKYVEEFENHKDDKNNSVMFMGQVGAGKSHLGVAICSKLIEKGIPVIYMAYRNVITNLKQHIMDENIYEREIKRYTQAKVLYIDDFLKGKLSESDVNIMYEIINYRYMNRLPIIISTEKSLDDLLDFDEAVGSRIIEMCRYNIVNFSGRELNYRIYNGHANGVA